MHPHPRDTGKNGGSLIPSRPFQGGGIYLFQGAAERRIVLRMPLRPFPFASGQRRSLEIATGPGGATESLGDYFPSIAFVVVADTSRRAR